ncbi:MAG: hypothetical protein WAZ38_14465 [Prolixibacteraceae bacterium]
MEKIAKRELLGKLMWDYKFPADELEALLEGRKQQVGHYTRSMLFQKIIETFPWFTVLEFFPPEEIRQLLTKELIQKLRTPSLRKKYGFVYERLQEVIPIAG